MALEKELEIYNRELPNLLQNEGKFALVGEDRVIDIYSSYEDAIKAGYKELQLKPFLVKQIQQVLQIHYFARDLSFPCHISS
jgi:hypothetical protein